MSFQLIFLNTKIASNCQDKYKYCSSPSKSSTGSESDKQQQFQPFRSNIFEAPISLLKMHYLTLLTTALLSATAARAGTISEINVYNSGGCQNYIQTYQLGDSGQDGECWKFDSTNGGKSIFSVDTTFLFNSGCSGKANCFILNLIHIDAN